MGRSSARGDPFLAAVVRVADDGPMFAVPPSGPRIAVVIVLSVVTLLPACGTPAEPRETAAPSSTTTPLGPRSVTVDVTGATPPPTIDVATLSIRAGSPTFREFRTARAPIHQRFAFTPPPGADAMGVVVRSPFFSDPDQSVDCTITVDGVTVDREEHVYGCSYSSDPRWTYVLIKGVIPGRYWPPTG